MCVGQATVETVSGYHFITCFNFDINDPDQHTDRRIITYKGFEELQKSGWRKSLNISLYSPAKDYLWICPECYKEWIRQKEKESANKVNPLSA